jgi:hypothetical protein
VYDEAENNINTESCRVVNINDFSLRYRGDEFALDLNKLLFSNSSFRDYFKQREQHFKFITKKSSTEKDIIEKKTIGQELLEHFDQCIESIEQKTTRSKKFLNDFCESVYTQLNNK